MCRRWLDSCLPGSKRPAPGHRGQSGPGVPDVNLTKTFALSAVILATVTSPVLAERTYCGRIAYGASIHGFGVQDGGVNPTVIVKGYPKATQTSAAVLRSLEDMGTGDCGCVVGNVSLDVP